VGAYSSAHRTQEFVSARLSFVLSPDGSLPLLIPPPLRPGTDELLLLTEYCPYSVFDLLQRARHNPRRLTPAQRLRFAYETALGMQYLHSRQPPVIHRDLKTMNLLVTQDWHVKVAGPEYGL